MDQNTSIFVELSTVIFNISQVKGKMTIVDCQLPGCGLKEMFCVVIDVD